MIELNNIYNEDCLEGMKRIPTGSVDMILCDLPYGTTQNKWDSVIPFNLLWKQYERVIKNSGAIILSGNEPFSSTLRLSNSDLYKYDIKWVKSKPTGFLNAKKQPLRIYEDVCVFYRSQCTYNPQGLLDCSKIIARTNRGNYGDCSKTTVQSKTGYPLNVLHFPTENGSHPTQKPVPLFEYLIKTYTNEGETVLDNCMGSGTTAIACINTNRNYIGFEMDATYYKVATERVRKHIGPVFQNEKTGLLDFPETLARHGS